ncbi:ATP-binding protein [Luteolibacter sp. AS25]|uniref:ATP-binding protein n=1 Tax=Luteolibacter sp. AS25 TaxID=3135776 RepID=UPI00398B0E9E
MTEKAHIIPSFLIRAVAICIGFLGILVISGWYLQFPKLVQILPTLAPMQYNTALCFIIASLGLCAATLNRRGSVAIIGTFLFLIGGVSGIQYILDLDLGVDELLFTHYIFTETSHPGRMSPPTALMFSLSGISLIYLGIEYQELVGIRVAGLLGSLVAILGVIAMVGYIFGLPGAYGWGHLTPMALHTALGALLLGLALMGISWLMESGITLHSPAWLPIGAATATLFATLVFWNALKGEDRNQTLRTVEARSDTVKYQILTHLNSRKQSLHRMAERWETAGTPDRKIWESDATMVTGDFPGYRAIVWVDENGITQWKAPVEEYDSLILGLSQLREEHRRQALEDARTTGLAVISRPINLLWGGKGVFLVEPLSSSGRFQGYLVGVIALNPFFDAILTEDICRGYCVKVYEEGEKIHEAKTFGLPFSHKHELWQRIHSDGADWQIKISPTLKTVKNLESPYPRAVLLGGVVLSMLLSLSIYLTQSAFTRSEEMASANKYLILEIAERQKAEKELEEVGALQTAILSHAAYAVISTDPAGTITSFNPAAEKILGYLPEEVIGIASPILFHLPEEIRSPFNQKQPTDPDSDTADFSILVKNARNNRSDKAEWTYRRKDGSRIPVSLAVSALSDQQRKITGYVFIASDISELKQTMSLLNDTHAELVETSRKAGMAEVASSVLHNVGNVLNSVNVSCCVLVAKIVKFRVESLSKASTMLDSNRQNLGEFMTNDPTGKKFPEFLGKLTARMQEEQQEALAELSALTKNIDHIKDIVNMQQSHATVSGLEEMLPISELIDHSLQINGVSLALSDVNIIRKIDNIPDISVDGHQAIQILVNLISNAKHACEDLQQGRKTITIRAIKNGKNVEISVSDNGIGIEETNLTRIFSHGFTTRPDGHGFGLHSSSLSAKLMGGTLLAESGGPGKGSTFTLVLPIKEAVTRKSQA